MSTVQGALRPEAGFQGGRALYQRIDEFFIKLGLKRTHGDANCYVSSQGTLVAIVIVYVDDLIFTGSWRDRVRSIMHLWRLPSR